MQFASKAIAQLHLIPANDSQRIAALCEVAKYCFDRISAEVHQQRPRVSLRFGLGSRLISQAIEIEKRDGWQRISIEKVKDGISDLAALLEIDQPKTDDAEVLSEAVA